MPNVNSVNTVASMSLELGDSFVGGNLVGPSFNHHNRNFGASNTAFQFNKFTRPHAKDRTSFIVSKYINGLPTQKVVAGFNRWDDDVASLGAFSGTSDQVQTAEFSDAIFESNFFGRSSQHFALNLTQRVTVRNNVWQTRSNGKGFIEVVRNVASGVTRDIWLLNNTCVSLATESAGCLKVQDSTVQNVQARGNLLYAPKTNSVQVLAGPFASQSNNVAIGASGVRPLASADPVRFADFKILNSKSASGAGLGLFSWMFSGSSIVVSAPGAPVLLSVTPVQ
jgi:hypothetical protein